MLKVFDAPDGTYRVYDTEQGDFGCYTADGKIVTLINISKYRLDELRLSEFLGRQGTPIPSIPTTPPLEKFQDRFITDYCCPICGCENRGRPPYTGDVGSYVTCPCCNFEYGFDDYVLGESFESSRRKWIRSGAQWRHSDDRPPEWDAKDQLRNIGIDINEYRNRS
jgi:hypothetical protein